MIRSRDTSLLFRMPEVTIRAVSKTAKTSISLYLTRDTYFPISGFPRCLHVDQSDSPGLPGRLGLKSVGSIRWASRSGSQRQRRLDWTPPDIPPPMDKEDVIARYSDSRHLLGSATSLVSMADALSAHANVSLTSVPELRARPSLLASIRPLRPSSSRLPLTESQSSQADHPHELPVIETPQELPVNEIYELDDHSKPYELSADPNNNNSRKAPTLWMADEDWADVDTARASTSIYMSLTCGDVLRVLEMPDSDADDDLWRVVRPSDDRKGWVPRRYLRPLEDVVVPRSNPAADASPIGGSYW